MPNTSFVHDFMRQENEARPAIGRTSLCIVTLAIRLMEDGSGERNRSVHECRDFICRLRIQILQIFFTGLQALDHLIFFSDSEYKCMCRPK